MREAVIVSSVRTPVGRAFNGTLRATRPDDFTPRNRTSLSPLPDRRAPSTPRRFSTALRYVQEFLGPASCNLLRISDTRLRSSLLNKTCRITRSSTATPHPVDLERFGGSVVVALKVRDVGMPGEIERYRGYAAECLRLAQATSNENGKRRLILMAEAWLELAEGASGKEERGESDES